MKKKKTTKKQTSRNSPLHNFSLFCQIFRIRFLRHPNSQIEDFRLRRLFEWEYLQSKVEDKFRKLKVLTAVYSIKIARCRQRCLRANVALHQSVSSFPKGFVNILIFLYPFRLYSKNTSFQNSLLSVVYRLAYTCGLTLSQMID